MKKAIKVNNQIIVGVPKQWVRPSTPEHTTLGYHTLPDAEHFADGWKEVITPVYNSSIEKLGELVEYPDRFEYSVNALSPEEIETNIINQSEANRQAIIDETIRAENEANVDATFQAIEDTEELLENIDAFPLWTVGETYLLNKKIKHVVNGELKLFKVNQPTLTADAIYPPGSPGTDALYTEVFQPTQGQQYEKWTERTGANASEYSIGKIVWYPEIDTQLWISKINSNTTVPDGDVPYNRYWEPYNP
ncbi:MULTISPECIES: hypothetical protein [Flavobacteriaceae]|uniref:hypothetical protein n=1 Tax=Flavobacteriaceae TaxID=49546 RepID=UPI003A8D3549